MKIKLLIFFVFSFTILFAQNNRYVLHPKVGHTISKPEKAKYYLFEWFPDRDFNYAVIIHTSDTTYHVEIFTLKNKRERFALKQNEIIEMQKRIQGFPYFGNPPNDRLHEHKIKKTVSLHPAVGKSVSASENKKYLLFSDSNNTFAGAAFHQMEEKYLRMTIRYGRKTYYFAINEKYFISLKNKFDQGTKYYTLDSVPGKNHKLNRIVLHEKVGKKIKKRELKKYRLFEQISRDTIKYVEVWSMTGNKFLINSHFKNGEQTSFSIDLKTYFLEKQKINHYYPTRSTDTAQLINIKVTGPVVTNIDSVSNNGVHYNKKTTPFSEITSIQNISKIDIREGVYWHKNPNPTRYLFSPSAFPLKKKERYYQNSCGILHTFQWGLTNNFSVGVGSDIITMLALQLNLYITPKISFRIAEKLHFAAGAIGAAIIRENILAGLCYSVLTYGNTENHITIGGGYGVANYNIKSKSPILNLAGSKRINRNMGLITENWILLNGSKNCIVVSAGVRNILEKSSLDISLVYNNYIGTFFEIPFLPYVSYQRKF